jgi:hypothetical protein
VRERGGEAIMWIEGFLPLPLGTQINLDHTLEGPNVAQLERFPTGKANAIVVGHELAAVSNRSYLVLEVELDRLGA